MQIILGLIRSACHILLLGYILLCCDKPSFVRAQVAENSSGGLLDELSPAFPDVSVDAHHPMPYNNSTHPRIYGGKSNGYPLFPYYVWIGNCGGALIDPQIVLTAAHCLYHDPPKAGAVVEVGAQREKIRVKSWAIHPEYGPKEESKVGWASARVDVAVIMLEKPVTSVNPVPRRKELPPAGTITYHAGRGENPFGNANKNLYYGTFKLGTTVDWYLTDENHPELLYAYGDQAVNGNKDDRNDRYTACPGDSGGPLLWGHTIIGTGAAVFLEPCGSGYVWWPKTTLYNPWIDGYISEYGARQPLYVPEGCYDKDVNCAYWQMAGQCTNATVSAFMMDSCKVSCGTCIGDGSVLLPLPPVVNPSPSLSPSPPIECQSWSYTALGSNRRFKTGIPIKSTKAGSMSSCATVCLNNTNCYSFQWQSTKKLCQQFKEGNRATTSTGGKGFYAAYYWCADR